MTDITSLKYADAEDKCFGVAGMALCALIFNFEDKVVSVSTDRDDFDSIEFIPEMIFPDNEGISPKIVWKHLLERFQIASSMMIANVVCRRLVRYRRSVSNKECTDMLRCLTDRGVDDCQLDSDEVEQIFHKNFDYLNRVFNSVSVNFAANSLAKELMRRHTLPIADILEIVSSQHRY